MTFDELDHRLCYEEDEIYSTLPFSRRKARIPYIKGWQFTVQQHIPPPVKLNPTALCTFEDNMEESVRMQQLHPVKRCLQCPPLPGLYGPFSLELQIPDTMHW